MTSYADFLLALHIVLATFFAYYFLANSLKSAKADLKAAEKRIEEMKKQINVVRWECDSLGCRFDAWQGKVNNLSQ